MSFEASLEYAQAQDKKDSLKDFKKQFYTPRRNGKKVIYCCGNSLGLLSKTVPKAIEQELRDWKNLAVGGYLNAKNPWLYYQHQFKSSMCKIMGCLEHEVTVMNTLTINLHLLLLSFYRPSASRYKIIMEAGAFPSDQYAVETQVKLHDYNPNDAIIEIAPRDGEKIVRTEDIISALENNSNSAALLLLGGINYYTGQLYDIAAITAVAKKAGIIAGYDLAHVAGNVPVKLHNWGVDFAVWCSYKYLNGGPGASGGLYIHEQYANDLNFRRMAGWWGNDEKTRFNMDKRFIPQPGAGGWQVSTAQVFNMVALKASLQLFEKAGMLQLRKKSKRLTAYLEFLLKQLTNLSFEIITPANPEERGAQLSLFFKENGKEIHQHLTNKNVVVDYREPGVIRFAPAPLYNSYEEVFKVYKILKKFELLKGS